MRNIIKLLEVDDMKGKIRISEIFGKMSAKNKQCFVIKLKVFF